MKSSVVLFRVLLAVFTVLNVSGHAGSGTGLRCIAIDAGHGGKDPGAVAGKIYEKHINLGVALKLGKMIETNLAGVKVVYTRKDDRFLELDQRSKVAADAGADLFISIHTNANPSAQPSGTETYVMGEDKGSRNLSVVMRENSVIALEADYSSRYEGYDPNSSESVIMFSLMQYAYRTQSLSFAELVQDRYASHAGRTDRGVKQAGFLVLWRTPTPSILTEIGFISNPQEAKFMASAAGQEQLAAALYNAVAAYKIRVERKPLARGPAGNGNGNGGSISAAEGTSTSPGGRETTHGKEGVVFRIQVKSATRKMAVNASNFGSYAPVVVEMRIGGRYKYFCGSCFSYKEALILQRKVREVFPDAFTVAFRDGVQVSMAEAIK